MILDKGVYDVVVCGGGFSGWSAAVGLARRGRSVLMLAERTALGWEATRALRLGWTDSDDPLAKEFAERMAEYKRLRDGRLDCVAAEIVLDEIMGEAGIDLMLATTVTDMRTADDRVTEVLFAFKGGEGVARGRCVVDATSQAALFRHGTNVDAAHDTSRSAIILNMTGTAAGLPRTLGDVGEASDVVLCGGMDDTEIVVEFTADGGTTGARLVIPELLKALRENIAELRDALVTHISSEALPLNTPALPSDGFRHPRLANLFGAKARDTNADAIALGTELAQAVDAAVDRFTAADADEQAASAASVKTVEADVIVIGGGTAGPFAAVAAAQRGQRVIMLEQGTMLGGIGTAGIIHSYYHGVTGGLQDKLDALTDEYAPLFNGAHGTSGFHPDAKKCSLERFIKDAGVELIYRATLMLAETEPVETSLPMAQGQENPVVLRAVRAATPEGLITYRAKVFIDATGDGDVAALAGAAFIFGREGDGLPHAYSLTTDLLRPNGRMHQANFDAGYCDPTDIEDATRARRVGLDHLRRTLTDVDQRMVSVAPLLGVRQARQIVGDYQLTLTDQVEGRTFPDVIAYAYSHYDNHARDYENESAASLFWVWTLGNWRRLIGCEVPYRCMLPLGIEGLLVPCRALSVTQDGHHQLRMQRDIQRTGEAAGVASDLCIRANATPRNVNIKALQDELIKSGALGKPEPKALPPAEQADEVLHEKEWCPAPPPMKPVDELVQQLGGDQTAEAAWRLLRAGNDGADALVAALQDESADRRFFAAATLAQMGRHEGAKELVETVKAHEPIGDIRKAEAARCLSSIALLGRLHATEAVGAISGILSDAATTLDEFVAAIDALGRIGDCSAAAAIAHTIDRDDLPFKRVMATGPVLVEEDSRWQLDLSAARALARLGTARMDLVEKHENDERLLVRRHAANVRKMVEAIKQGNTSQ